MPRAMPAASGACARPRRRVAGSTALTEAVARALFKLMAYKDEYEVARLYTETDFLQRVAEQFEGPYELRFHLAPPLLADRDPRDRASAKAQLWPVDACRLPRSWRSCAGCAARRFDIFGRTAERRTERRLIGEYEAVLDEILSRLSPPTMQPPSNSPRCRSKSAASATSRRPTWRAPRRGRQRSSLASGRPSPLRRSRRSRAFTRFRAAARRSGWCLRARPARAHSCARPFCAAATFCCSSSGSPTAS